MKSALVYTLKVSPDSCIGDAHRHLLAVSLPMLPECCVGVFRHEFDREGWIALELFTPTTVPLDSDPIQAQNDTLDAEAHAWINRMLGWHFVCTGENLLKRPEATTWNLGWYKQTMVPDYMTLQEWPGSGARPESLISELVWAEVVLRSNRGMEIPNSYSLLRHAKSYIVQGQRRMAVIEFGVLVEKLLETALSGRLAELVGREAASVTLRQTWQLARRLDLARALGLAVPAELTESSSVRNKVAHSSYEPTAVEVDVCAAIAEEAVRAITVIEPLSLGTN